MGMLTVVCVQVGNYLGRGVEYVRKLKAGVEQHLTLPHRFVCLTDHPIEGVECLPARFKGWWEKLHIFEPGLFAGRVMFLDLDTYLVGNIDHVARYDGHFATLHDFWRPVGLGPAVMLFDPKWAEFIWQEWAAAGFPQTDPRGDQGWIENLNQGRMRKDVDILQEMHPGEFFSYKTSCTKELPAGARVVCFHGRPRPHEAQGWAREHWEAECLQS
jgi:hypothetical protein